jgi:hypothetical protein
MPKPGKSKKFGSNATKAESRLVATIYTNLVRVSIHNNDDNNYDGEVGPAIVLSLAQMSRYGEFDINLSKLTEEELIAFKAILDEAFEWALPIARVRDAIAQEVFEDGGEPFDRIYRAVPTVHYRKRAVEEYDKGVFYGPDDARQIHRQGRDSSEDLGGDGSRLAESREVSVQSEDDGS